MNGLGALPAISDGQWVSAGSRHVTAGWSVFGSSWAVWVRDRLLGLQLSIGRDGMKRCARTGVPDFSAEPFSLAATASGGDSAGTRVPHEQDVTPSSFWAALSYAQRDEFRLLAEVRTFAAGARLMQEGETAYYVIVILDGRTRISVRGSNGTERVVAHRGPGQLIGERAALRVNVRSATVVALAQVQALAMATADFAGFLTAHPDVLRLVEEQLYERLTESSSAGERPAMPKVATVRPVARRRLELSGQNCTTIFSDVVAFGSSARSEEHRRIIRHGVLEMTKASLASSWNRCHHEDRGDGLLVIAPPEIPTVELLNQLLTTLPIALKRHNTIYADGAQIQLRIAVDVGPVTSDELGVSGQVIINAARLLDALALKKAMVTSQAPLGVVVSDFVRQSTVGQAHCLTQPDSYSQIEVKVKEASLQAWMLLAESPFDTYRRTALSAVGLPRAAG